MSFSTQFLDQPVLYPFDDAKTPGAPGVLVMGASKEGIRQTQKNRKKDFQ
jgi:hypothetical protein